MPLQLVPPADGYNHLSWPDGSHDVKFRSAPTVRQRIPGKTTLMQFDGRVFPLAYFPEASGESWDVEFMIDTVTDGDQFANLRAVVDGAFSRTVLVWTDVFGNQINCVVTVDDVSREYILGGVPGSVSGRPLGGRYQRIGFTIHRVE